MLKPKARFPPPQKNAQPQYALVDNFVFLLDDSFWSVCYYLTATTTTCTATIYDPLLLQQSEETRLGRVSFSQGFYSRDTHLEPIRDNVQNPPRLPSAPQPLRGAWLRRRRPSHRASGARLMPKMLVWQNWPKTGRPGLRSRQKPCMAASVSDQRR